MAQIAEWMDRAARWIVNSILDWGANLEGWGKETVIESAKTKLRNMEAKNKCVISLTVVVL